MGILLNCDNCFGRFCDRLVGDAKEKILRLCPEIVKLPLDHVGLGLFVGWESYIVPSSTKQNKKMWEVEFKQSLFGDSTIAKQIMRSFGYLFCTIAFFSLIVWDSMRWIMTTMAVTTMAMMTRPFCSKARFVTIRFDSIRFDCMCILDCMYIRMGFIDAPFRSFHQVRRFGTSRSWYPILRWTLRTRVENQKEDDKEKKG